MKKIDFYGSELNLYRAALHTHTTNSDGRYAPEEVIKLYADEGYDVMAITDHRFVTEVDELDPQGMTLLRGVELHPLGGERVHRAHLLCIGVPQGFDVKFSETATDQQTIDTVRRAGALCYLAHPHWCGYRSCDVQRFRGLCGIEVYNTSCRYIGREYNMQLWDELSDSGAVLPALAVDDVHHAHDLFRGWTMIAAPDNSPESLLAALSRGSFFATQGPEFKRISFEDGIFEAEFSPCTSAVLVSNMCVGRCGTVPNYKGDGMTITATSITVDTRKIAYLPFMVGSGVSFTVRCQIQDAEGRMAWSNPIRIN